MKEFKTFEENEKLIELVDAYGEDAVLEVLNIFEDVFDTIKSVMESVAKTLKDVHEDIFKYAEFENKVRYNHLHERLCDIDDELMQLQIDRLCTELDIEIAESLGENTELLEEELAEIIDETDKKEIEYEVVHDFYDKELFEILSTAEEKKAINLKYEEVVERLFF